MSVEVKLRRGTGAENAAFTGLAGEVTVDTTDNRLVVHDGSTAGGFPLALESEAGGGGGGLDNVVEDLSPQLGGDLDMNSFQFTGGTYGFEGTASGQAAIKLYEDTDFGTNSITITPANASLAADTTITIPSETFALFGKDSTVALTSKTIDLTFNTLTGSVTEFNTALESADFYTTGGTDVALADGGTGASLSDPNADRILFWDDSGGAVTWLTPGNGLTITTTTIAADSASTIVDGIVELATDAETITGTDTARAITPSNLTGASIYGYLPQNSQSTAYTLVAADQSKHILHPTADNNARTFTIPANATVAFPIGTTVTFINQINTVTIAITSDTLVLAGSGSTGSRTLAANGVATAVKVASTEWIISGTGLT